MRKEGRCCYVIDVPTRSFSWLPGTEEEVGTTANTAVRKGKGRHRLWGTHSWAETMPINQRLVHLAMPSGTPLCAEGESGAETAIGTVAKASPSLLVGALLPCSNDRVGRAGHGKKRKDSLAPIF